MSKSPEGSNSPEKSNSSGESSSADAFPPSASAPSEGSHAASGDETKHPRVVDRVVFFTAIVGLIGGCVGLSEEGVKLIKSRQKGVDPQVVHIYHHAPFWESLVSQIVERATEQGLLTEGPAGRPLSPPKPSKPPALPSPSSAQPKPPSAWFMGGMLSLVLASLVVLIRKRL